MGPDAAEIGGQGSRAEGTVVDTVEAPKSPMKSGTKSRNEKRT